MTPRVLGDKDSKTKEKYVFIKNKIKYMMYRYLAKNNTTIQIKRKLYQRQQWILFEWSPD